MRVLLIRPPAHHTVESEVPEAVEAENLSYPPLSLLAIASFLLDQTSHEVDILDAQLDQIPYEDIEHHVRAFAPDVVGITCFTVQLVDVRQTIAACKRAGVQRVVLGGPHINDFPHESVGLPDVDAVVKGEGQQPMLDLLAAWDAGKEARGIDGVVAHADDPIPENDVYFSNDLDVTRSLIAPWSTTNGTTMSWVKAGSSPR